MPSWELEILDLPPGEDEGGQVQGVETSENGLGCHELCQLADLPAQLPDLAMTPEGSDLALRIRHHCLWALAQEPNA